MVDSPLLRCGGNDAPHITGYPVYEASFPLDAAERGTGDSQNEEGSEGGEAEDPIEALKVGLGKAGVAAIDLLYNFFACVYDLALV